MSGQFGWRRTGPVEGSASPSSPHTYPTMGSIFTCTRFPTTGIPNISPMRVPLPHSVYACLCLLILPYLLVSLLFPTPAFFCLLTLPYFSFAPYPLTHMPHTYTPYTHPGFFPSPFCLLCLWLDGCVCRRALYSPHHAHTPFYHTCLPDHSHTTTTFPTLFLPPFAGFEWVSVDGSQSFWGTLG